MKPATVWAPPALMAIAALFTVGIDTQRSLSLRASLADVIPVEFAGHYGEDKLISDAEVEAAGVTDYLMRDYRSFPFTSATTTVNCGARRFTHPRTACRDQDGRRLLREQWTSLRRLVR